MNSQVSHDQRFFQLLIELLVNLGKPVENTVHPGYDIISGLGET